MKNKIFQMTEEELKAIIKEEVQIALCEYATRSREYYKRLDGILPAIQDNLISIAIYHHTNPQIIPHWVNRAKQLGSSLFAVKPKQSFKGSIDAAFEDWFGEHGEDIDATRFNIIILYYKNKPKQEQMLNTMSAEEYCNIYGSIVAKTMFQLKDALLAHDLDQWQNAVDEFVEKINNNIWLNQK